MGDRGIVMDRGKMTILCIGAHPDDCEFRCSGTAARWAEEGNRVVLVSVTDGRSGHHEMDPVTTVERRREEAARAAELIGAESRVLDNPDGALEPTLENRFGIIRLVREVKPDVIITNRPNDYHPDHRYTALLVQDSAYSFMVPHIVPDAPALPYNPVIFYWADSFTYPRPFQPIIAVNIDGTIDKKLGMLNEHVSQLYEWLPWVERYPEPPPAEEGLRRAWLERYYKGRNRPSTAERYRDLLVQRYGPAGGEAIVEAEAFELCEYGTKSDKESLEKIFAGL